MSEVKRIAGQLRASITGPAWHGPSITEILDGVTANEARQHPVAAAHSMAEIVPHITAWMSAAERRLAGEPIELEGDADWPPVTDGFDWSAAVQGLRDAAEALGVRIRTLSDADLTSIRILGSGQEYSAYVLIHGVVQHNLYHAGQLAVLKKAIRG
ncbi:MAG TPA: DinB family protein [Vicinamibacterales bacterium]|nr:DinB family protein [Vicinamibacterales bacterium]